jgi:hypothetical protein
MRPAPKPKENADPNPVDPFLDPDPEIPNFGFESGSVSLLFIKD